MFIIRVLSSADIAHLNNIAEDVFDNPVNERYKQEFLEDPRHHIVVGLVNGAVIGFASPVHYIHPDKPPELWINEVGVAPDYRNIGVGKAILHEMLRVGRQLGRVNAWVLTDSANTPANGLYKSAGGQVAEGDTVIYEFPLVGEQPGFRIQSANPNGYDCR